MKQGLSIAFAATLGLAACGQGQGYTSTALRVALDEPASASSGRFARFVPLQQAGRGPALDVRIISSGVRGGFLRESKRGTIESWLGTDGVSLTFDRGVLHGTRGIGAGLLASDVSATAAAVLAGRSGEVERLHTFLTGNDLAETRAYRCTITTDGSDTIQVDAEAVVARRMTEICYNLDQEFKNVYWVDTQRGQIVKSEQWAGETIGSLSIQTVYVL